MFYTIAIVLIVLWLLGLLTSNTMGDFLLAIAVIMILVRIISGRRVL